MDIDLHIHTNASDGSYSPSEIIAFARERRLGAIAITDHDTIDGVKAVAENGMEAGLRFLTGVELTAQGPPDLGLSDSLHILGYGIRPADPELNRLLFTLQKARDERTPLILRKLQRIGVPITREALTDAFPGPQLGRPHIAQLMVHKGVVASIDEAFDRYLSRGKPAYVDKVRVPFGRAIAVVSRAGGVAVLAHPGLYKLPEANLEPLIRRLMEAGLRGIEVHYPEHSTGKTVSYEALARRYGLLVTGGTDFHGAATPGISIGCGFGDLHIPYGLYETLLQAIDRHHHERDETDST